MAKKIRQQYGIKYPFTADSNSGYLVDTNTTLKHKIRSILMHVIFTPKGQKLRDPSFGTDLIKYIFEPNEDITWNNIKDSINRAISLQIPDVSINNLEMLKNEEDPHEVYVKISYLIQDGANTINDNVITKI